MRGDAGRMLVDADEPLVIVDVDASYDQELLSVHAEDVCVLVSDGVTEALDGTPLEDSVPIANGSRATATEVCDRFMTKAAAGPGPPGVLDWDDDARRRAVRDYADEVERMFAVD